MTDELTELERLRAENARLRALAEAHGIDASPRQVVEAIPAPAESLSLTPAEKVFLFRNLFRGRTDVYPIRWQSTSGRSGYSPACANEWRLGTCEKPRIKCSDCSHSQLRLASYDRLFPKGRCRKTTGSGFRALTACASE